MEFNTVTTGRHWGTDTRPSATFWKRATLPLAFPSGTPSPSTYGSRIACGTTAASCSASLVSPAGLVSLGGCQTRRTLTGREEPQRGAPRLFPPPLRHPRGARPTAEAPSGPLLPPGDVRGSWKDFTSPLQTGSVLLRPCHRLPDQGHTTPWPAPAPSQ